MNQTDPSDEGAPTGAPKPIPVPPEVLAEAHRTLNLEEIEAEFGEVQAGREYTYEQCIEALDKLTQPRHTATS
jgi:hypothetical protein